MISLGCSEEIKQRETNLLSPNNKMGCFNVPPLIPTEAPPFYSATTKEIKDVWDTSFNISVKK